jgi:hypothetical protein
VFSDLELFVLFVSALCHDVDHRGTNNSYQVMSVSCLTAECQYYYLEFSVLVAFIGEMRMLCRGQFLHLYTVLKDLLWR